MLTESVTGLRSSALVQRYPIFSFRIDYYNLFCLFHTLISSFVIKLLCYSKLHQNVFTTYFKLSDKVLVEKANNRLACWLSIDKNSRIL